MYKEGTSFVQKHTMKLLQMISVALLSFSFILFPVVQVAESALSSADLVAPVIEHTLIEKDIYSGQQVDITATVTDNVGIKNVTLFYRDANAIEFRHLNMNRDLDSFVYTAQLTATDPPGLEYYIQATDQAGNTLLFGYSFSPLTIAVMHATLDDNATSVTVGKENLVSTNGCGSVWVWWWLA